MHMANFCVHSLAYDIGHVWHSASNAEQPGVASGTVKCTDRFPSL